MWCQMQRWNGCILVCSVTALSAFELPHHANVGHVLLTSRVLLYHVLLCHVLPHHVNVGHVLLTSRVLLYHVLLCHVGQDLRHTAVATWF